MPENGDQGIFFNGSVNKRIVPVFIRRCSRASSRAQSPIRSPSTPAPDSGLTPAVTYKSDILVAIIQLTKLVRIRRFSRASSRAQSPILSPSTPAIHHTLFVMAILCKGPPITQLTKSVSIRRCLRASSRAQSPILSPSTPAPDLGSVLSFSLVDPLF